jgi:hypothetical protein
MDATVNSPGPSTLGPMFQRPPQMHGFSNSANAHPDNRGDNLRPRPLPDGALTTTAFKCARAQVSVPCARTTGGALEGAMLGVPLQRPTWRKILSITTR